MSGTENKTDRAEQTERTEPVDLAKAAQEIIEEYEAPTRDLAKAAKLVTAGIAILLSLFSLYGAIATIPAQIFRTIHVMFVLILTFLYYPARKGSKKANLVTPLDFALILAAIVSLGYVLVDFNKFIYRAVTPTTLDLVLGSITIVLILEATRRTTGWILPAIVLAFIAYAYVGPYLPQPWTHRGYDLGRIVGHMYMTLEGIFGVPIDVSSTFIILFTIYGAVLEFSGAGKFFVDFSFAAMGKKESGAGRTVTMASFLLGTVSGSGVATTVTLGSVAYPLLKRAGYDRDTAGAILAAGGIGAVISPPVLGAASFLIAEILKVSYLQVLRMAMVPTILYYLGIWLMIELDTAKRRHRREAAAAEAATARVRAIAAGSAVEEEEAGEAAKQAEGVDKTPSLGELTRNYWFHFTSLISIVALMVMGFTAVLAVFVSILLAAAVSYFRRDTALTLPKIAQALEGGAKGILSVAPTCASAGIIVGVVTLTGLGLKFSGIILDLAHGQLFLTLLYTALILLILGLALPITASYIVAAVMTAPALIKLGVPDAAAHMFIFYYAVLSEVSPPVALSPVAAAALTGGNPFRTMMITWKYALPTFLVPFMFTATPAGMGLLLMGNPVNAAWVTVTGIVGVTGLVLGVGGYVSIPATWMERALLTVGGLALLYPAAMLDVLGLVAVGAGLVMNWWRARNQEGSLSIPPAAGGAPHTS